MSKAFWILHIFTGLIFIILNIASAQVQCRYDSTIPHVPVASSMKRRSNDSRPISKQVDFPMRQNKRSIARCRGLVESVEVPEDVKTYLGVPIGGVVSIIESTLPWEESKDGDVTPICSGIFVEDRKVISSAHCVFHQRRDSSDSRFWLFGEKSPRRRYFYAVAGKSSQMDNSISVYPLQSACIPESYTTAENETVTSGQMNDMVIFTTLTPFRGDRNSIAEFVHALPSGNELKDYMLPQYPLDVSSGAQLVIDVATSPLYKTTYFGGTFYSVDLVSWIGSSGGAIIDIKESQARQKPVLTGLLMSEGWQLCDSGMLPITSANEYYYSLISGDNQNSGPPSQQIVIDSGSPTGGAGGPPPLVSNALFSGTAVPLRKNDMKVSELESIEDFPEHSPHSEFEDFLEPSPDME